MTFISQQKEKHCFIACSEDKVNAGICDCINRMRNKALRQPPVISSVCDIHKGTRCEKSFPSYTDGKCRECGGQAN